MRHTLGSKCCAPELRLARPRSAVYVIGMKFDDAGTCQFWARSNLEAIAAQHNQFGPCRRRPSPGLGTLCVRLAGKDLERQIRHQGEPGKHPEQLEPQKGVGKFLPKTRMHGAPPALGIKRAEMIRHSPPLMSPRTTRRDTGSLKLNPRLSAHQTRRAKTASGVFHKITSAAKSALKRAFSM